MKHAAHPWLWVPTLYFAEGIPYFLVNNISVVLFKKMGMSNADLSLYTSLLYLPWIIKPFWSPFVDLIRTKRWWVLRMEQLVALLLVALPFTLPSATGAPVRLFLLTLALFWITAFASATHDIAADGFYMLGLTGAQQSFFVGIRSTFYRLSNLFVQGALVVVAGVVEDRSGSVPLSWKAALGLTAFLWAGLTLYHAWTLPQPSADTPRSVRSVREVLGGFGHTFTTFFRHPGVWAGMAFMLLYRLPEAFALKLVPAFLLDAPAAGGLGLSTVDYGLINNTVGVVGLVLGGILGGAFMSRAGLRRALWPMALSLSLPCAVYGILSVLSRASLPLIGIFVFVEQLGYGFGFTAYMVYMMFLSEGAFKTSHYALCTAFMAASMMLPGLFAGFLQERWGYPLYFGFVMLTCLATFLAVVLVRRRIPSAYGRQ